MADAAPAGDRGGFRGGFGDRGRQVLQICTSLKPYLYLILGKCASLLSPFNRGGRGRGDRGRGRGDRGRGRGRGKEEKVRYKISKSWKNNLDSL